MDNGASSYRRFLDGEENGMVAIIRDYKDGLLLYINGIVGNLHAAEEVTEETFFRLVVKKPRFSGKSAFKTWLYAIGRNAAIDFLRHRSRKTEEPPDMLREEESLEQSYIRQEQKIVVHRTLKKLKPEYRQVLYLTYFEGFDNTQAAAVMKKNKRQIENLVYRAKQSLKSELDQEDFHYEGL